ncbi:MAG: helix-turn-helix domain-containing protein [Tannerella sp.]|jgi:transcriptional regulator with XRE-family HTH domain|nr:helix-turn-helix domain-containing protein [Tannerella sp.]
MKQQIFIGELINRKLSEHGMSKSEFARRIGCSRGTVYNIFNSKSLDIELLIHISEILGYDFTEHYRNQNPES